MFGPVESKKRKQKTSGRAASSQQQPKGSKAGLRSWFGKGLEIKGSGSGASTRQKDLDTLPAASAISRSIQNATDLSSDCSLNLRESVQQFEVQSVKPLAVAARADSPVRGIDALIPALPRQGREGAAVRIQRWYRHRQAERQAAQQDVRDFVQQRRHAAGVHTAEGNEGSASYTDREALAASAVAKAARLATEKQEAEKAVLASLQQHRGSKLQAEPTLRDLREGLKQASKTAETHHTEQPGPDQHQLQSDDSQQDCLPSITLSVSPRQSQQSSQGISAANNSKLIGLPLLTASSPPQLLSRSAAADRITAGASQPLLQRAPALGQQDSDMPSAAANPSMAQATACALDHQLHVKEGVASSDTGSAIDVADTASAGSAEPPGADKASLLAKTVYEGVKQRMHQLQANVQARDQQVASLQAGLEAAALHRDAALKQAQTEQQCALDEQKKKLEGDMTRHLAFIDRLLADKDKLSAKCMQLGKDMKAAEAKHAAGVESLKEGWVVELKRQKEAWSAAEKGRRDTWLADKTKQVKELTVKGMEPEIQRLIAQHKAELQSERDKAQDHTRVQLDDVTGQNEKYARQLRDRLLREQDLAVERERAAAQDRLREAAERYEGQMQSQRLRMVSDSELRLEQFQAERKDEKRRYEDALDRLKQGQGEQEQQLRSELSLEKAQVRRQHERELQALRDKMADEQEGWRLAIAKRAKEELTNREAALRTQLMQERDHQLQVVVERLETEAADNREAATKEAEKWETALKGRYQAALQAAQDSEHKHAERFRVAGQAEEAAQQRNEQLQSQVAHLQQHLQDQRSGLADAKQQVTELQGQLQARDRQMQRVVQQHTAHSSGLSQERQQLLDQVSELRQRQTQELKQVL
ncbi:hypothetical protein WJX82_002558 [Trebouxia sp. C0006]